MSSFHPTRSVDHGALARHALAVDRNGAHCRRRRRAAGAVMLALTLTLLTAPRSARADRSGDLALGLLLTTAAAVDVGFAARATVLAARGDEPELPASIAEAGLALPQAVLMHGVAATVAQQDEDGGVIAAASLSMLTGALLAHGAWSAARPDEDPATLLGGPSVVGIDGAWTAVALGQALGGQAAGVPLGIAEMSSTAPALGWSLYQGLHRRLYPAGSAVLAAWSGALFLHGAAMVAIDAASDGDEWARRPRARGRGLVAHWSLGPLVGTSRYPAAGATLAGSF